MSDIKVGIIGAGGYWGPNWVRVLSHLDVLHSACDSDQERLDKVLEGSGKIHRFTSVESMLKSEADAVFIVTPPKTHREIAVAALEKGKHVFIEKPLAQTEEECLHIEKAASGTGLIAMVGHTFLYHPCLRKFKTLLGNIGELRTIYTVRANFGLYQHAGILLDLLPHDLSIFAYLTDYPIGSCESVVANANDIGFFKSAFGAVDCCAFLSWSYPDKTRKVIAVGTQGILEWDLAWTHILLHKKHANLGPDGYFSHSDEGTVQFEVPDRSEPLMNEALHFLHCIRTNSPPFTGLDAGRAVVKGLAQCQSATVA